ncbi:MAG: hypothetical protein JZU65_23670 [Chlorobium sp.]|nr:hypothetical protein [Chlorobium sp.]
MNGPTLLPNPTTATQNGKPQQRSRRRNKLPDESLPYFRHGWSCDESNAVRFLDTYPMKYGRNKNVRARQISAICTILANIGNGGELILPNCSRLAVDAWGYARTTFYEVMAHMESRGLVIPDSPNNNANWTTRRVLTFSSLIRPFKPARRYYQPEGTLILSLKKEKVKEVAKINTVERRCLNARIRRYWDFLKQHKINSGLSRETFNLYNNIQTEVDNKEPLLMPDEERFMPYIVFNDPGLTLGGRFYGAFWIGCKKELRRQITIDGESTADMDGKAMHVQLLYNLKGAPLPPGDPYLYTDERRNVTKMLMLYMLNTKEKESPVDGRKAVANTYHRAQREVAKREKRKYFPADNIPALIEALEKHHDQIIDDLYQSNWGNLQKTESGIMLNIIERGMADNVVILPVHDGCLCPQQYGNMVLEYFKAEGIIAAENLKHKTPHPIEQMQTLLRSYRDHRRAS